MDYECSPFNTKNLCVCVLGLCVVLWPSMLLYGSTSKVAFSAFLLFHLLPLLVCLHAGGCVRTEQCLLWLGAKADHHSHREVGMACPLAHQQGTPIYTGPD